MGNTLNDLKYSKQNILGDGSTLILGGTGASCLCSAGSGDRALSAPRAGAAPLARPRALAGPLRAPRPLAAGAGAASSPKSAVARVRTICHTTKHVSAHT